MLNKLDHMLLLCTAMVAVQMHQDAVIALAASRTLLTLACMRRRRRQQQKPRDAPNGRVHIRWWHELVDENGWREPRRSKHFQRLFRMPLPVFEELAAKIRSKRAASAAPHTAATDAEPAGAPNARRTVSIELALAMTMRYLAGGSYLDIMLWAGLRAHRTFYKHVHATLLALDEVLPEFTLERDLEKFDTERMDALKSGFKKRSYGYLDGCIGALDGLLLPIISPTNLPEDGARKYYTRKNFYAWNVQAVCDADCRFTHVSMLCVGSTHDSFAWAQDRLAQRIEEGGDLYHRLVMEDLWIAGDEAYSAAHTLATPWTSRSCQTPETRAARLAYNYYHSSARITIERAFGQLTKRYLLLKRPYTGEMAGTDNAPGLWLILRTCMKLVSKRSARPARARRAHAIAR